jgi:hypothetical protein
MYFWPEVIKRRLCRSDYFTYHNHPQIRLVTAVLIALAVLCEFLFFHGSSVLFKHLNMMIDHVVLEQKG